MLASWPSASWRPTRARGETQRVAFRRAAPTCELKLHGSHTASQRAASPALQLAAQISGTASGEFAPGPRHGCVIENAEGRQVAEAYQAGYFGTQAEVAAVARAAGSCAGGTAYLNLEPAYGSAAGDTAAVDALIGSKVSRVVVGLLHPLPKFRGQAVAKLRAAGIQVDVPEDSTEDAALCRAANEALLHRVAKRQPFSIWKYAMTLDGKIATTTGHASWVSSPTSRGAVHDLRAQSDAVIIGGETLRRDNPHLTTRKQTGHIPARVVLTRTCDMPLDRHLWDVNVAPTIVITEAGGNQSVMQALRQRGVEIVILDKLLPVKVAEYCYARGYLQCLWECGGVLAAAAVADNVLNKVHAYVSLKVVGGTTAPSPLGDLGITRMDAALQLQDAQVSLVGPDVLVSGYLPASGTLANVAAAVDGAHRAQLTGATAAAPGDGPAAAAAAAAAGRLLFYKGWDEFGFLSNFSPIGFRLADATGKERRWLSVEHYYQAQKFCGAVGPAGQILDETAREAYERIAAAATPEEAARVGRGAARNTPGAVRADWPEQKEGAMLAALRAKFAQNPAAAAALLATRDGAGGRELVENSQNDYIWGIGFDGTGTNLLGKALVQVREELWRAQQGGEGRGGGAGGGGAASAQHQRGGGAAGADVGEEVSASPAAAATGGGGTAAHPPAGVNGQQHPLPWPAPPSSSAAGGAVVDQPSTSPAVGGGGGGGVVAAAAAVRPAR